MKISVDDQELFTLTEIQKKVIMNDIHADEFEEDIRRRLQFIISQKYDNCFLRLRNEWMDKLRLNGVTSMPLDPDEFAKLVFSQPEYQDRKARDTARGI